VAIRPDWWSTHQLSLPFPQSLGRYPLRVTAPLLESVVDNFRLMRDYGLVDFQNSLLLLVYAILFSLEFGVPAELCHSLAGIDVLGRITL
ncbi:hypothetical protein Q0N58_14745, partial [Staphylococcus aureus]|nr:hypothetical protein [Staphylococcus aureus]